MTVWTKQGVVGDLCPQAQKGFGRVCNMHENMGHDVHVTAIRDGNHMNGSFHYIGQAWDMRKELGVTKIMIKDAVGVDFDVIEHDTHFHIEYDPK